MRLLKKKILFVLTIGLSLFLCSCKTDIKVSVLDDGKISVEYFALPGKAFLETIAAISGESIQENQPIVINQEAVKESFVESGLEEIDVSGIKNATLDVKGKIPSDKSDVFSQSGIIDYSQTGKNVKLVLSKKTLKNFYEICPYEFQSYIDLFMAPAFSDEEMTTEEYVDLVASVYGQELADEVLSSKLRITFQKNNKTVTKEINLVDLFNISSSIVFE